METKTDVNDGKWHVKGGDECPLHEKTRIEVIFEDSLKTLARWTEVDAQGMHWGADSTIICFRVIKEYKEPKELWAVKTASGFVTFDNENFAKLYSKDTPGSEIMRVREVLD